jgi:heme A synthase
VRKGAVFSAIFIILEALLGAGLVLFELVADNDSVARAISMAVHLANTFLLIGSITLTAWWAGRNVKLEFKSNKKLIWLFGFGFFGILLIGMSGAVTALGDTLFPPVSLSEGLQRDFSSTAHFAERLRIYHPLLAIGIGIYLLIVSLVAVMQRQDQHVRNFAAGLVMIFFIQLVAGAINVVLLAPIWLQLVHLLLADILWIIFTLLVASSLAKHAQSEEVLNMQELSSSNPALSISETA